MSTRVSEPAQIWRSSVVLIWLLIAVLCLVLTSDRAVPINCVAAQCPPKDPGWSVRICEPKVEAPGVRIEIGLGGLFSSHRPWREWRHGDPTEFPLPVDLLHAKEIWIKGISLEEDKNVYMGLVFNGHVVKHMDFDNEEEHEHNRDDTDEWDCP
jgi:hypothetical protein